MRLKYGFIEFVCFLLYIYVYMNFTINYGVAIKK
jgi:hypothetical protein